MSIDTATGYLAGRLQYSQTDQNSICTLAIFYLSEKDQSITGESQTKKGNKDMAETIKAVSPFPAAAITSEPFSLLASGSTIIFKNVSV